MTYEFYLNAIKNLLGVISIELLFLCVIALHYAGRAVSELEKKNAAAEGRNA